MKNILVLGSTGSIGLNALKVIKAHPDRYRVVGLAAGRNVDLLLRQIEQFRPVGVATLEREAADLLSDRLKGKGPIVYHGPEGFKRLAAMEEVDTLVSAMSGAAGLIPTYAGIEAGKQIALANKETMVMAGPLVVARAIEKGASILPIDSEHSAILQSLLGHPREDLKRIIITASGGPFREMPLERMATVTPEEALRHPTWNMGRKITVDSATLMNKGLEVIEAKWLFDLRIDQISILVHPQSVVHSMVEYNDGSLLAQMGIPDMTTPISYALAFPRHMETSLPPLKLEEIGSLSFMKPDRGRFPCLGLAFRAAETGGSMPAVLNAANEVAVELFLNRRLGFLQIPELVERTMNVHVSSAIETIDQVLEWDRWARKTAVELSEKIGMK
ncbi:MAG: 1-deoxy-D-xylulose-5-phosphate reductoisomerase [Deltaproteobacteria bacterium]|nr:1-deoxy-D-xylulose-5-phosphate reductoisomerase [Deltaproteobacteria bacterium]